MSGNLDELGTLAEPGTFIKEELDKLTALAPAEVYTKGVAFSGAGRNLHEIYAKMSSDADAETTLSTLRKS
eukprot:1858811-Pyramimonas_sp.AAC.1